VTQVTATNRIAPLASDTAMWPLPFAGL
jgi:hypothetical protein